MQASAERNVGAQWLSRQRFRIKVLESGGWRRARSEEASQRRGIEVDDGGIVFCK